MGDSGYEHSALPPFDAAEFVRFRRSLTRRINRDACDFWDRLRGASRLPLRRDLDPMAIPRLLPSVILLEVIRPSLDFRYRLVGTRWVYHFGRDDTRRLMSEIPHQRAPSRVWRSCVRAVETGMPQNPDLPYVGEIFGDRKIEAAVLPLTRGGEQVNELFVTVDFSGKSAVTGPASGM